MSLYLTPYLERLQKRFVLLQGNAISTNPLEAIVPFIWDATQLDDGLRLLAQKSGFIDELKEVSLTPPTTAQYHDDSKLNQWLDLTAAKLGVEVEEVETTYHDVNPFLQQVAPALLRVGSPANQLGEPGFILLLKGGWRWAILLAPDSRPRRVKVDLLQAAFCYHLEQSVAVEIDQLLANIDLKTGRLADIRLGLLREKLADTVINNCWLLRMSVGGALWPSLRKSGLLSYLTLYSLLDGIQYTLFMLSLGEITQAVIGEEVNWAILFLAILASLSRIPANLGIIWLEKLLTVNLAKLLKQRLFHGVLSLKRGDIRDQGIGQFLAWVTESNILSDASLIGATWTISSVSSLVAIGVTLIIVGDWLSGSILFLWLMVTTWVSWRLVEHYNALNKNYTSMINGLLERLRGHQTRLIQETDWYKTDDQMLAQYLNMAQVYNYKTTPLQVIIPYGWVIIMLLTLSPDFISIYNSETSILLGVRFAALLFGFLQFQVMSLGLLEVAKAVAAWRLIAPIRQAAAAPPEPHPEEPPPTNTNLSEEDRQPLLVAHDLKFRYIVGGRQILDNCSLVVNEGDHILLEGPSGGGKSTLASVLIGLRQPESGLLLLWGLDKPSLGEQTWRQAIVAAPQFHENYILNATLAFNLLMGHNWPPTATDLQQAEIVCRELGLGELLDKMPQGLNEPIGDLGWQLSHGERSRIYIARALLQKASLIIFDESFASLDPENMEIALTCVLNRVPTLVVIAHP